ncbi:MULTISPECIES: M1 family metallopeptidase [Reichenbachiella]|uniref:M1 family metallopeptidase n=1 Tax=Reichenbachiella TaxID=156993 RepID=UPI000E6C3899|nr:MULTISPECIES: M1 family metallopeptidase [Reichenbachiella]MBU2915424.1 M1 family metallopeptidase [Reichenbachiella agariperforans]RJE72101.1 aminopeptidase [Reichenbachiella sp. MSK19-1]
MRVLTLVVLISSISWMSFAQDKTWQGKFEPIDRMIDPPSTYRTASGAPGADYWQQRADYKIKASLDEKTRVLSGEETITYYNNSPDELPYLWLQLEQNVNRKENEGFGGIFSVKDSMTSQRMQYLLRPIEFEAGYTISYIKDASGKTLKSLVNNTMMKVMLPEPLQPNTSVTFSVGWSYPVTDRSNFLLSREGYEYFPEDDNCVFLIAHWFPRMAVYNDTEGWQNQQFQKLGEFALEFGNYDVEITVPADHLVAATGELQNDKDILSSDQKKRMTKARKSFDEPIMIVTPEEAAANEKTKSTDTKTWKFHAENVRDFAFASSRKFIWDAQAVKLPNRITMAMSFYPKEGLPVWSEESTQAVVHALEVYSEATFNYPYPVAISVNTSNIGMEFPMISFNGGRPIDGEMSHNAKEGMIRTIVHEVGHNWFPMIVSSDERKWMWMDEGLNTYLDQKTMAERYPQFHSLTPKDMIPYMDGDQNVMRPIMVTSDVESLYSIGANFYDKPTAGFQILRESVMGPELFDAAFKEYAIRWMYKHPNPADLFRTLEDASAVDLDWFWRGWYFTTDKVDINLTEVKWFQMSEEEVVIENKGKKVKSKISGKDEKAEMTKDFSAGPQPFNMINTPDKSYGGFLSRIDETAMRDQVSGKNIYELTLKNEGGLIMPVIIEWTYTDGSTEIDRLPAEVWRLNEVQIKKTFLKEKEVASITIDPRQELPDVNMENNTFPRIEVKSEFDAFKE